MLVIGRTSGQSVRIGRDIVVKVIRVHDGEAKLAIHAPRKFVYREELSEERKAELKADFASPKKIDGKR